MSKITYADKIGITPKDVHINQVWDDDMNEIKDVVNENDDRIIALETGGTTPIDVSAIWTSGFSFDCTADNFPVNNVFYSATPATVVLSAADLTLDRIDLIVAKTTGLIQVIEGTLATTALVVPPDYDPSEYYVIKQVIVRANTSSPEDTSKTLIYDENLGTPTEWNTIFSSGTIVDSTNDAFSGTHSIEATNPLQGDKTTFQGATTISTSDVGLLTFYIKLKADFSSSFIYIKFLNGVTQVGSTYTFNDGDNGFSSSALVWQKITIDASKLNLPVADFDGLQIYPYRSFSGYFIDLIEINQGSGAEVPEPVKGSATIGVGTILDLTNIYGTLYNMSSASSATTYTTTGSVLNAYSRVLVNATSEPNVTGANKIFSSVFSMGMDMYMVVWYNGNRVEYWFEEI